MNLITDHWMPVFRKDGTRDKIAPWQITSGIESNKPIVEIDAPRADFKGALYQFLIGLLQTTFAPGDDDEWLEFWENAPNEEVLRDAFYNVKEAFEIDSEGPAFMQSFNDPDLLKQDMLPIEDIVGGSLSSETRKKNKDLFVKRGIIKNISPYWAAVALFSVQVSGVPAWGQHRVGLRGNGPTTTLVLPTEAEGPSPLWKKFWLNVLDRENFQSVPGNKEKREIFDTFPWMAETRKSPNKKPTLPKDCNPLQHYWPLPRRIRLIFSSDKGTCDLSGDTCARCVIGYKRIKDGVYYTGEWMHPLTPYYIDPKKKNPPNSKKVQSGGFVYHHWPETVIGTGAWEPSKTVRDYLDTKLELIEGDRQARLWVFGYDADNANVRCWYESTMPIFPVPQDKREDIQEYVTEMINAASSVLYNLRTSLRKAWFSRPKDAKKGDFSFIDTEFWNRTEKDFYRLLAVLIRDPANEENIRHVFKRWQTTLRNQAESLFDQLVLSSEYGDGNIERVVKARRNLIHWLRNSKQMKNLTA